MGLAKNTLDRSDISTYPIKVKYSASYVSSSANSYGITVNRGINGSFETDESEFLVYKLAKQLYYNSYLTGAINLTTSSWNDNLQSTAASGTFDNDFRYFPTGSNDLITVMAIPRNIFGENIGRKTLSISGSTYNLIDDGNGNVVDANNNLVHVGNVLYNQGIVVITNKEYEYALIPIVTYTVNFYGTFSDTAPENATMFYSTNGSTWNPIPSGSATASIDTFACELRATMSVVEGTTLYISLRESTGIQSILYNATLGSSCPVNGDEYCENTTTFSTVVNSNTSIALTTVQSGGGAFILC